MKRKLYRIRRHKMLGGVAAGLSEYFDVDVVFLRLFFVLATFFGGAGLISYIVLWIITPEKDNLYGNNIQDEKDDEAATDEEGEDEKKEENIGNRSNLAGIVLIAIGVFLLADSYLSFIHCHNIFPIILIGLGLAILLNYRRN